MACTQSTASPAFHQNRIAEPANFMAVLEGFTTEFLAYGVMDATTGKLMPEVYMRYADIPDAQREEEGWNVVRIRVRASAVADETRYLSPN